MANKKKEGIPYGSVTLPDREHRYSLIRWGWKGLNRTDTIDSGNITDCSNVSVNPPYVDSCSDLITALQLSGDHIIGIYGFDDYFIAIHRDSDNVLWMTQAWCVDVHDFGHVMVDISSVSKCADSDGYRSVVRFNAAVDTENIAEGKYERRLLIYPDQVSVELAYNEDYKRAVIKNPKSLGEGQPNIRFATVYASRLFGVSEDKVYASGFNDYTDWRLDTADDISEAHAWTSMTQSNPKADGTFTGITTYDNHAVLFKKDFTQLVYSSNNPFRIVDLTSYGADNPSAYTEANGVLYFASHNNVYAFTGGIPKALGDDLAISDYTGVCLGSYKDRLYMCIGKVLYEYRNGAWSKRDLDVGIVQFASVGDGLYGLTDTRDYVVMIDSKEKEHRGILSYGDWWFETDLMCAGKLDIRRAKKISLFCEAEENASVDVYLLRDGEEFDPNNPNMQKILSFDNFGQSGKRVLRGMIRGFSGFSHKLRIAGSGKVRIYSAELLVTFGGDLYRSE